MTAARSYDIQNFAIEGQLLVSTDVNCGAAQIALWPFRLSIQHEWNDLERFPRYSIFAYCLLVGVNSPLVRDCALASLLGAGATDWLFGECELHKKTKWGKWQIGLRCHGIAGKPEESVATLDDIHLD